MVDQIVITEKTSQAKDIRAAVGSRYGEILPAEGHLFDLLKPEDGGAARGRSQCIALGWRTYPRSLYASPRPQPALAALGEIAMRTEQQIDAAAAAAAEKANGGKFTDPLFYKPEHRAFWKEVIRTALDAADAVSASRKATPTPVSKEEVQKFSEHCVYIRSVWVLMMRIWRDSDENERKLMEA